MTENHARTRLDDAEDAAGPRGETDRRATVDDRRLPDGDEPGQLHRGEVPAGALRRVAEPEPEVDRANRPR